MVRGRDACWEHCVLVDATRQKVRCNYCHREFSGGVYRMKFHLAQIKNKDIIPCAEVPDDVRDHIQSILSTPKKQKTPKKLKVDKGAEEGNGQQNSSSASGGCHPNHGSSGQNGSTSPSFLFRCTSLSAEPLVVDDAQKQKRDDADKKVAVFFYHSLVPMSAAKSMYYQEMMDAVANCGVGYKAPTYDKLRSTLLEQVKGDIHDRYMKYREAWKETGCTILCDSSRSDSKTKSIVVFSVASPKGTLFLKSVDVSGHEDDTTYLLELLESIVMEVGVENVIQVVTDITPSYAYIGRILMNKYSSLFWCPCASSCIDKMLEDLSKLEWVGLVLEEAKTIARYIYSHTWSLNMMKRLADGKELIRPKITRFVTHYLTLRSIVMQEDNVKHVFSHSESSRRPDAQAIRSLLNLERFWKSAHEAVTVFEPLVSILRVVDGHMASMGYVYEGIERAKLLIKSYYKGVEEKYMPVWEIIDRTWNMQLYSPLHAAAAFLNPSIFYNPNFKMDLRMRNGFQEAMIKLAITDKDKVEITKEHPVYVNAQGALGTEFAIMGRTLNSPGDWWASYGYEVPTLQRAAVRILSQPCSSHCCRWNWSTFESIHAMKRNKVELDKLNDLVFVHCNLWLRAICQSIDEKCKPIVYDEIDVGSDWPTELEPSASLLDDSWLENLPLECRGSP